VIDIERNRVKCDFKMHKKPVYAFVWCACAKVIASAGLGHHILLWSPYSKNVMTRLTGHTCSIRSLMVNNKYDMLFSLGSDGTIKVWEVKNQKHVQTLLGLGNSHVTTAMLYDHRYQQVVAGSNGLSIWNLQQKLVGSKTTTQHPVKALYNENFHQVVSVDMESSCRVWNVETGTGSTHIVVVVVVVVVVAEVYYLQ
jgi:WD40 repeat protein